MQTIAQIESLQAKHLNTSGIYIEDAANVPAVFSTLREHVPGLVLWQNRTDKVGRAYAITPLFEGGSVFLPSPSKNPWVESLAEDLISFPAGKHDDTVDALTCGLLCLKEKTLRKPFFGTVGRPSEFKRFLNQSAGGLEF